MYAPGHQMFAFAVKFQWASEGLWLWCEITLMLHLLFYKKISIHTSINTAYMFLLKRLSLTGFWFWNNLFNLDLTVVKDNVTLVIMDTTVVYNVLVKMEVSVTTVWLVWWNVTVLAQDMMVLFALTEVCFLFVVCLLLSWIALCWCVLLVTWQFNTWSQKLSFWHCFAFHVLYM